MSSSLKSSSEGLKYWWGKLRFENNHKLIGDSDYHRDEYFIDDKNVVAEMDKYIDYDDKIIGLRYYTSTGIHSFTLIETNQWYWTLEKHDTGVSLQRSKELKAIVDYFGLDRRTGRISNPFTTSNLHRSDYWMGDVIRWLYNSNELCKGYDLIANNCRDFARRLIHQFCSKGEDVRFDLLVVVVGAGHMDNILGAPIRMFKALFD